MTAKHLRRTTAGNDDIIIAVEIVAGDFHALFHVTYE